MNKYSLYSSDQLEELFSNYLINSWSYSKVETFSRNEKAFEMTYIYNCERKQSASGISGKAYHSALDLYFKNKKLGATTDIIDLEQMAFSYIESQPANVWKIQKTTPTVEDAINKATANASKLLRNFLSEIQAYESDLGEIIDSEIEIKTWLTVNGVDIPMPCNMVIDLVITTKDGKQVIIDHKSKTTHTDDAVVKFVNGKQAITYALGYEAKTRETIDEVWFIENKVSANKDRSPQLLVHKYIMDEGTRKLYEALLYEPLKKMIEAVSNPDYVYTINDSDTMTDKAELYDFWAKTMIAEVEDFEVSESKKPILKERLRKIRDASLTTVNPTVIRNFKTFTEQFIPYDLSNKNMTNQEKIEHILRSFGIVSKVQHVFDGFSSTTYLLELNAGISIASIYKYRLDMANALNVPNVRIQKDLLVYEGKSYLAIESGKKASAILAWDQSRLVGKKIPIGVDNFNNTIVWNLDNHSTPHMLICGATGSGKSVSIKSTIEYALTSGVDEVFIFDPKHEFTSYKSLPGVTVVNEIDDIETQMGLLVLDMEDRVKSGKQNKTLVVFDEFADSVANSRKGNELKIYKEEVVGVYANGLPKMKRVCKGEDKSLEENLRILLQKGRSSGFRIIAATQRASTKVITGDAKVNFPVQVCFRVPKDIDSQVVIDEPGAESLNGRGDFLLKSPEYFGVVRGQGFYKE